MGATDELELLTKRFLAGETTLDEERRLYGMLKKTDDATEEQKLLMDIICPPAAGDDTEVWLSEDESGVYDSIMRRHRLRITVMRWAAAAVFAGLIFMAGMKLGSSGKHIDATAEAQLPASAYNTVPADTVSDRHGEIPGQSKAVADGIMNRQPDLCANKMNGRKLSEKEPSAHTGAAAQAEAPGVVAVRQADMDIAAHVSNAEGMTAADSMEILIERMERDLANVEDSVYLSHVEQIIKTDKRFQKLMNRIIVNDLTRHTRNDESHNIDNKR